MSLELQINNDIKNAMLAKEKVRLTALRAIKAAILLAKTAEGASHELSDADVLRIIQKLVKQRRESAEIYKQNGREDLAGNELAELSFMDPYLPKTLSGEELEATLRQIISQTGASGPSDMGKVMGIATKQLAGQADGRQISETVKKLLA